VKSSNQAICDSGILYYYTSKDEKIEDDSAFSELNKKIEGYLNYIAIYRVCNT
jgi:hypothetical protein